MDFWLAFFQSLWSILTAILGLSPFSLVGCTAVQPTQLTMDQTGEVSLANPSQFGSITPELLVILLVTVVLLVGVVFLVRSWRNGSA